LFLLEPLLEPPSFLLELHLLGLELLDLPLELLSFRL
jgi:hypothetical protein